MWDFVKWSVIEVKSTPSVAKLLVPPVSGGQFAGAVFAKASDTSLWVLRAKLFDCYLSAVYLWWRQIFYFLRAELKKF